MKYALLLFVILFGSQTSSAEGLSIAVVNSSGTPVPNAVVMFDGGGKVVSATSFDWVVEMEQSNLQFSPYVLVAPVGSRVAFPNRDRVRHHVYSFSKGNRFELELYGRDESRYIEFEKTGVVAVGCNIHDNMIGYIRIVDTPFAAKTDEHGVASFVSLPVAATQFTVWHPDMKGGADLTVARTGQSTQTVTLDVSASALALAHH